MDDRGTYIDFLFRNGLKDHEVLPPPEIWEHIRPSVPSRPLSYRFLRIAAMVAVLMSLSVLAYRWNINVSERLLVAYNGFNIEASAPLTIADNQAIPALARDYGERPQRTRTASKTPVVASFKESVNLKAEESVSNTGENVAENENETLRQLKRNLMGASSAPAYYDIAPDAIYSDMASDKEEKWSLGAIASPTYYSRFGGGDDPSVKQMVSSEQARISYTGGVAFYYKLSRRFSIQSGLFYSSVGQEVDGINTFTGFSQYDMTKGSRNFEVMTTNGKVFTNNADVFLLSEGPGERVLTQYTTDLFDPVKANLQYANNYLQQNFSYVELPIMLRYKIIDRAIDLNIVGGISYNMLVGNKVFTYIGGDRYNIGKTEGISPILFSSALGMGMEYSFTSSFSLNLEPTFRYYLDPFNPLEGSRQHPYSFGIFSGVRYKF